MTTAETEVSRLLKQLAQGDPNTRAVDLLLPAVYDELHALAKRELANERANHTLQPTALVHEAYVKLVGQHDADWKNRTQFICVAAQAMRRILVDHARAKYRVKRGGGAKAVSIDDVPTIGGENETDFIALDDALNDLAKFDPTGARIVEMKFFGGLTMNEIAQTLGISKRSVEEHWRDVRLLLHAELRK
jgi:RNA polymerase sigma-70 factor, ECF subfamily